MQRQKGFTLLELMVTVAIIAIIAAVAYPAFTKSAMKGRRADAKAALNQHAQALERCYGTYGLYNSTNCSTEVNSSQAFITATSQRGYYTIKANTLNGTSYQLYATAVSPGAQANDTGCTILTLNSTGQQGSGANNATTDTGGCW